MDIDLDADPMETSIGRAMRYAYGSPVTTVDEHGEWTTYPRMMWGLQVPVPREPTPDEFRSARRSVERLNRAIEGEEDLSRLYATRDM